MIRQLQLPRAIYRLPEVNLWLPQTPYNGGNISNRSYLDLNLHDRALLAEANQVIKAQEEEKDLEVIKESGMEIKGVPLDNKPLKAKGTIYRQPLYKSQSSYLPIAALRPMHNCAHSCFWDKQTSKKGR